MIRAARGALFAVLVVAAGCPGAGDDSPPVEAQARRADPRLAVALALFEARRLPEAEAAYRRVLEQALREGDEALAWAAELGACRSRFARERTEPSLAEFDQVWSRTAGDPVREAHTAYHAAMANVHLGRLDDAEAWAERARRASERTDDPECRSLVCGAMGTLFSYRGQYHDALRWNEERVALWRRESPGSTELARALNNVGIDYRHFGRLEDAAQAYDESLAIYRAAGDRRGAAMALHNLANVRLSFGELDAGLELKLEALRLATELNDPVGLGMLHGDLGEIYRTLGNLEAARSHGERALELHRSEKRAYGEVQAEINLAQLALELDRPADAAAYARESLAGADRAELGKEQAVARAVLALAEARLGHSEAAVALAREAVRRAEALDDPEVEVETLEALGEVLESTGRLEEAAQTFLAVLAVLDSVRGRLTLGDLATSFAEPYLPSYEGAIRTLLALGRPADAFDVMERARARRLLELLAERDGPVEPGSLGALRRELRQRHGALQRLDGASRESAEREVEELERRLLEAEARARELDPLRAATRLGRSLPFEQLRAALVAPDRPLLAWFWGERQVYGWHLDESGVRAMALGAPRSLGARVQFLRRTLEDLRADVDWRAPARGVYRHLVAPLLDRPGREIIALPDGPLAYVPLEALLPDGQDEPLGLTRTIVYGPSASVLAALAAEPASARFERDLLAVAASAGERGPRSAERRAEAPLPFAAREVRAIVAALPGWRCDLLVDRAATLEGWRALAPERYRRLHFATHARVVERPVDRTRLLLSGSGLDLPAIRALRLRTELVTLSACETALGRQIRGEGVVGLTHAFLAAGARSVVASLWKVDDRSTAEFMERFYRSLRTGLAPAHALREARRASFAARDAAAHPSVWAAFVLTGPLDPPAAAPRPYRVRNAAAGL